MDNKAGTTTPAQTQARTFAAPARVNLIGEHTDYTGGYVLPLAIAFTTQASIAPAAKDYLFKSAMYGNERQMTPADRSPAAGDWTDYPVGVLRQLQALGIEPPAFELSFESDVPPGSGLSSSASIEVATAMALLGFAGRTLELAQIATLCRRAENDYVGSPCGIMDQFVVAAAEAGKALLLHTRDLVYELLPLDLGAMADYRLVVANSLVRHSIAGGDYGLRRREVEAGQQVLCKAFPKLRDLGDATLDELQSFEHGMPGESFLRCRHIVTENARVLEARAALLAGDATRLGQLMTQSHTSQRDDFACSVPEIDFLVETANSLDGCLGARLTGGGFGGSTVSLVRAENVEDFRKGLMGAYREAFGIDGHTYLGEPVNGAIARARQVQTTPQDTPQGDRK